MFFPHDEPYPCPGNTMTSSGNGINFYLMDLNSIIAKSY